MNTRGTTPTTPTTTRHSTSRPRGTVSTRHTRTPLTPRHPTSTTTPSTRQTTSTSQTSADPSGTGRFRCQTRRRGGGPSQLMRPTPPWGTASPTCRVTPNCPRSKHSAWPPPTSTISSTSSSQTIPSWQPRDSRRTFTKSGMKNPRSRNGKNLWVFEMIFSCSTSQADWIVLFWRP